MTGSHPEIKVVPKAGRFRLIRWFRNRFIAGILVALPIVAVFWLLSKLIGTIDNAVWSIVPDALDPANYYDFPFFWLLSVVLAVVGLTLFGIFVSNQIGTRILRVGESALAKVPVVAPIYNGIKQILNTIAQQKDRAFRDVCLIEYPREGIWAVGFVTADLSGAPKRELAADGKDYVCVFLPTTPNPTSGFLLFAPTDEIKLLDMTPEEGAKMIISGGMVSSNEALEEFKAKQPTVPLTDETLSD
ncbi:DUF502 domain-containing protein [uncultured Algimonas sp.]|uniref:DUF502 domain-containing protein n=1 Tax=uncultured Algimonas sp. TaxID=1547920 RepID=UPI002624B569|nr:DUF502 domain-containing protein [uncultured Algimonas sp.]